MMQVATELTFNQPSYESGRRDERDSIAETAGIEIRKVYAVLDQVRYLDWKFFVGADGHRLYMQVSFDANGEHWNGRKWLLSPHMTRSEIVQTAFKAVMTAVEHEVRESFLYKERAIFGPHYDIEALLSVCDSLDVRANPKEVAGVCSVLDGGER